MGPGLMAAAPYLMGGGALASMFGDQQAASKRRDIMNQQLARTASTQDHVLQQVLDEGQKYSPQTRMAQMIADQQRIGNQSQADLGAATPVPQAAGPTGVSQDYQTSKALSDAMEGSRMGRIAGQLAASRAPGQLMTEEGMRRADLAGDVAHQWNTDKNMANATQLDAQQVQDPWYGQLGKVASQLGTVMALAGPRMGGGTPGKLTPGSFSRMDRGQLWGD